MKQRTYWRELLFVEIQVAAGDVLIAPAVIDGCGPGSRIASVESVTLNGVPLDPKEFEIFDGSQTTASKTLIAEIKYFTEYHIFRDVPYVVLRVPYREEFSAQGGKLESKIVFTGFVSSRRGLKPSA